MKRSTLAMLVCLVFASVSYAQQNAADAPASREDVERYLDAMHSRETIKNMMDVMTQQVHKMTHEQLKKVPNLPPDYEARMDREADQTLKNFPTEDLLQVMIPVYQKHFSKGDIDAMIGFYATPTGQKLIRDMPAVMAETMQASSGILQKMMAKTMERVQEEIAQLQKEQSGSPTKKTQQN
jgi:hypothetical protein